MNAHKELNKGSWFLCCLAVLFLVFLCFPVFFVGEKRNTSYFEVCLMHKKCYYEQNFTLRYDYFRKSIIKREWTWEFFCTFAALNQFKFSIGYGKV